MDNDLLLPSSNYRPIVNHRASRRRWNLSRPMILLLFSLLHLALFMFSLVEADVTNEPGSQLLDDQSDHGLPPSAEVDGRGEEVLNLDHESTPPEEAYEMETNPNAEDIILHTDYATNSEYREEENQEPRNLDSEEVNQIPSYTDINEAVGIDSGYREEEKDEPRNVDFQEVSQITSDIGKDTECPGEENKKPLNVDSEAIYPIPSVTDNSESMAETISSESREYEESTIDESDYDASALRASDTSSAEAHVDATIPHISTPTDSEPSDPQSEDRSIYPNSENNQGPEHQDEEWKQYEGHPDNADSTFSEPKIHEEGHIISENHDSVNSASHHFDNERNATVNEPSSHSCNEEQNASESAGEQSIIDTVHSDEDTVEHSEEPISFEGQVGDEANNLGEPQQIPQHITEGSDEPPLPKDDEDQTGQETENKRNREAIVDSDPVVLEKEVSKATGPVKESAPEGSLADFFDKLKKKKGKDKSNFSSGASSFEQLAMQQEQINAAHDTFSELVQAPKEEKLQEVPRDHYSGLPWGVPLETNRRIPDMDLLYMVFQDRMNEDINAFTRQQSASRFPLSMGDEFDDDLVNDIMPGETQAMIDELTRSADVVSGNPGNKDMNMGMDQTNETEDDLRDLFLGVDPPDELDVGAAAGSSMHEFIMGKGRRIIRKRIALGYDFIRRGIQKTKEKIINWRPTNPVSALLLKAEASSTDHEGPLQVLKDWDWRATISSIRASASSAIQSTAHFFENLFDGEDTADVQDDDDFDLDVIRKLSGLKS